ncbi:Octaprenyl-diphosphate synthase [Aquicella siphonis]|uniref:Octaprenyl-diphosphate synthase n=1 Tax=Aquicella siphonis TaxID=254247 RepID=A0A5E4PIN7_9COXI|nr:polyprenyl synthetase family protein [Aquicella siphonis]VVC76318.1 Octaprenyl-diphosphate synthase [Aquicella siphonis]
MPLESIRSLVSEDLQSTDRFIISRLESNIPMVKDVIEYVLTCGGKRVRPLVLLLSARALNHQGQKHIDLAAVIELIHTATLLHDDVVDDSTLRRGHKTANTIWGNDTSVLVGDFLYSRAFQIVVDIKHDTVLDIFAKATPFIAEGEILQLVNCNNPDTTEQFYFDVIERKTAKLFEIAAQLGATLSTESAAHIEAMRLFGLHLGLAYQLIDDALDYSQSVKETGKNVGQDISEGKTTLPLIHAMRMSKGADLELMRNAIQTGTSKNLDKILGIIESTDAIKYTAATAKQHALKAKEALSAISASPYRQALETLSDFVVSRTY